MVNTNTERGFGSNTDNNFEISITDTEEHYLPDTARGDPFSVKTLNRVAVKIVNKHDENANVTLQGTTREDPEFQHSVDLDSATTNAEEALVLADPDNYPFHYYRVAVDFTMAPTTGSIEATYMSDDA